MALAARHLVLKLGLIYVTDRVDYIKLRPVLYVAFQSRRMQFKQ